ncbi:iron uptake transporter deferrochelatase/peroxidase subunit [Effusibacillus dendaii]|uniref:Deferrochelatase n=1 Tax=Effusibacillus dendaii TaxID=2743772 RepID=A0A7I8D6S7_9BACL|nr:iron uptake transporter deferrochelatase/peroxidase subunit [Effusibacillus dendaii]BCJ85707.1 putative deferrochelatase/peroxidase EfeN [Effusibacillus dendaii]
MGKLDQPISRREMFKMAAATGFGAALGLSGMRLFSSLETASMTRSENQFGRTNKVYSFYGSHQAGIDTPAQGHMVFAAFDVTAESRKELQDLLRTWSEAAARMCAGKQVGDHLTNRKLPPEDTGESVGLFPSGLSITIGFGPTLFNRDGMDRFGLAERYPTGLAEIPAMPGDALQPERSGGDICIQACADDPQIAFYAVRNLVRVSRGVAAVRWLQQGFLSTPQNQKGVAETPRNLFGFKDGTANIDTGNSQLMNQFVWVNGSDQPAWMQGGTYLVARRIRMLIEVWDRSSLDEQESTFGRTKLSGAGFGMKNEFDPVNPNFLPENSHVRLAHVEGTKILRRGYSYVDGIDPKTGQLDAGLFFISFQRNISEQFIPLLRRLAAHDALNEYTLHTSSAVFACPPGVREDGYIGETLFV